MLNYLTFLYNKKLSYIKNKAIDQLINTIKNVYEDNVKNIYNILLLLKKLSLIAYDLDENDDCQKIGNLIFLIYYSQLQQKSDDVVAIMDDFVTDYFKINFLLNNKRGSKNEYYDNLISNILKVFYFLVKVKSIQGISTFFNSLKTFKNTSYKRFESYNFQFIIGMTFCLEMIDNEKLQKEIINWIKKVFIIDANIDDFTLKFNDYYGNESLTQKTYQTFNCDDQKNVLEKMLTIYDFKHIKEK